MKYNNVLKDFKIEFEALEKLKGQCIPEVPYVNDSDNDKLIIKWSPIFMDSMSRTFGIKCPLAYVLRENIEVPDEEDDPLGQQEYYRLSGSLQGELISRLHRGVAALRPTGIAEDLSLLNFTSSIRKILYTKNYKLVSNKHTSG